MSAQQPSQASGGAKPQQQQSREVTMNADVRQPSQQNGPPTPTAGGGGTAAQLQIAGAKTYRPPPRRLSADGVKSRWTLDQLRATDGMVPLQSGTNQFASQHGMTGFGTPRNTSTKVVSDNPELFPSDGCHGLPQNIDPNEKFGRWTLGQLKATDGLVRLQAGTNQFSSQRGMTGFGTPRDVKGSHLKRIWELEYPEEAAAIEMGYSAEEIAQEALNTLRG